MKNSSNVYLLAYNTANVLYAILLGGKTRGCVRMQNTTLERRMELIRQARELSSRNRETINGVQKIFTESEPVKEKPRMNFFGLKILVAVILFTGYVFLDLNIGGNLFVSSEDITKAISYNLDVDSVVEETFSHFK